MGSHVDCGEPEVDGQLQSDGRDARGTGALGRGARNSIPDAGA